jgi:hypothetical protein
MKWTPLLAALVVPALAFAHAGEHEDGVTHDPSTGEHTKGEVKPAEEEGEAAQERSVKPSAEGAEASEQGGLFDKGRWVFRGSASFDLNKTINLGGENSADTPIAGGINLGVGYLVLKNLSLDVDAQTHLQLSPAFAVRDLGLTPGMRYQVLDNVYVRAGMPIILLPEFGLGVLAGAGYVQPIGSNAAFVVGVDYTYYLTEYYKRAAPSGRLDVHAGVQTWF